MLDPKALEEFDDPAFLKDVFDTYIKGGKEALINLKSSLDSQDYDKMIHWSHKLKGSSRMIGARSVESLAEQFEKDSRSKENIDAFQPAYDELLDSFQELSKYIENKYS